MLFLLLLSTSTMWKEEQSRCMEVSIRRNISITVFQFFKVHIDKKLLSIIRVKKFNWLFVARLSHKNIALFWGSLSLQSEEKNKNLKEQIAIKGRKYIRPEVENNFRVSVRKIFVVIF